MANKRKIVFFGTTDYSAAMLDALVSAGYDIALVVTLPDRPSKRGRKCIPTPVKKLAEKLGIPVVTAEDMRDPFLAETVVGVRADIGVIVAFKILPESVYAVPALGTVNVHPSLLPELRGPAPVRWAVIRGYRETGVTTFILSDKPDTGDILLQEKLSIGPDETYGELFDRIIPLSEDVLLRTIEGLFKGILEPKKQEHKKATKAPKIKAETAKIDWKLPANNVHNLIRGMSPEPGATARFKTDTIKILRSRIVDAGGYAGEVLVSNPKKGLVVACGEKAVEILELQAPSKKPMDAKSFLCGFNIEIGEFLL
ncbi:methionyl-tRNA formyltransferase [bacterium]|nr:MAG: methionyl-tRNA formyltransferase [bacterium]